MIMPYLIVKAIQNIPNSPKVDSFLDVRILNVRFLGNFWKRVLEGRRNGWVPECGNGIYVVCVPFYDRNFVVFHEK